MIMKTTIILIRHGQTNWNYTLKIQGRGEVPLDTTGINQIKQAGETLKEANIQIDKMLSSPLGRAIESSMIIKTIINFRKPIELFPLAIERDFGNIEGTIMTPHLYEEILSDKYETMESTKELTKRCKKAVQTILSRYQGSVIVLCTHSHFIKGIFSTIDDNIQLNTPLQNGAFSILNYQNTELTNYKFNLKTIRREDII